VLLVGGVVLWNVLAEYMHPTTFSGRKDLVNMFVLSTAAAVGSLSAIAAVGNFIAARNQLRQQRRLDAEHSKADAQQKFFETMYEMLMEKDLKSSHPYDDVALLARAQSLTVLKGLNVEVRDTPISRDSASKVTPWNIPKRPKRINAAALASGKGEVITFLHDTGLIDRHKTIVNLAGADITRTNLVFAKLNQSNLRNTNLGFSALNMVEFNQANLSGANLWGAYLIGAKLNNADLTNAEFTDADLTGAKLNNANLSGAKFRGRWFGSPDAILNNADLSGADLSKADISDEQLAQCSVLKGATMPDGTKHP